MVAIQRPVKGSRISSFYPVQELPPLASLDSAFQLQEYISLLIRLNVHDVDTIVSLPGKSGSHERDSSDGAESPADKESKGEVTVDESCWIYEQLRRLAQDLSHPLITTLQQECTRQTCPEMKAGEWLYLCVAHGNEGAMEQCCAIDYILHTLDSATALLNSPRAFPSRLSIPPASTRHFSSLARRLGRVFAHAYYHHREAFEQAEAESSLYARFLALTSRFKLVPNEFLVIPSRMNFQTNTRPEEEGEGEEGNPEEEGSANLPDISREDYMNTARRIPSQERQWLQPSGILINTGRGASPPDPAGDARNPSPRKGRSRTDTMVHSEAVNMAEELAKGQGPPEADINASVAQESVLSVEEPAVVAAEEHEEEVQEASTEHERTSTAATTETVEVPAQEQTEEQAGEQAAEQAAEHAHLEPSEPVATEIQAEEEHVSHEGRDEPKEESIAENGHEEVDVTEGTEVEPVVEAEQPSKPADNEQEADIAGEPAGEQEVEASKHVAEEESEVAADEPSTHEESHAEPAAQTEEEKPELTSEA